MNTIYRIEDEIGAGMYESCIDIVRDKSEVYPCLVNMINRHEDRTVLPNYNNDVIISEAFKNNPNKWYKFYFNSIERLKEIIKPKERKTLKELGFKLYKVTATDFISSPFQTVILDINLLSKIEIPLE